MGLLRRLKTLVSTDQRSASGPSPITVTTHVTVGASEWIEPEIVPAEQRVTDLSADEQGLYPYELLMLEYAHTYTTDTDNFQQFWWYSYGVRKPRSLITSLTKRGFLRIGGTDAAVAAQTGAALKNLLRDRGMKVSGKKADLVERALASIPHSDLDEAFPQRHYEPTDTGAAAIAANPHIGYIHRSRLGSPDIYSLTDLVRTHPHTPWRDLIWGDLNQQRIAHATADDWGLYSSVTFNMAEFIAEEQRWNDALAMLTEVIYYDLSGMDNGFDRNRRLESIDYLFPYEKSIATIPPGITERLTRWASRASLTDDGLADLMRGRLQKLSSALRLFADDEIVQIAFCERDENTPGLSRIYAAAEQRLRAEQRR